MPRLVQFKRGTTAQNAVYGGLIGELTVDTDKDTLVLHDGSGGLSTLVTEDKTQTVTNKTLSLADNTFSGIDGDGLEIVANELNVDGTVVRTSGNQTIDDIKTFTSPIAVNNTGGITTDQTTVSLFNANAETINFGGAATDLQLAAGTGVTTINNDLSVVGDFTVIGTFTSAEAETLIIEDKNIILADSTSPTDALASDGGIILKGSTDKTFKWFTSTNAWTSSEHIDLAENKSYFINGNEVLAENELGPNVVSSSLQAVGAVSIGTWQADTIGTEYGGTGQTTYTDGELLIGNSTGNTLSKGTLSAGAGIAVANSAGAIAISNVDRGSSQSIFKNVADDNGDIQFSADSNDDTITFEGGGNIDISYIASQKRIIFEAAEAAGFFGGDGITLNESNEFNVDATVVRTSGEQTIDGVKTFESTISGSIDGNAATANGLNPGAFINGVFFDGTENITLQTTTLEADLFAGDGLSSSGEYNGSVERTFINADKGSSQPIFKNILNENGTTQIIANSNSDELRFSAGGDLQVEFDSTTNEIKYSVNVPDVNAFTAGDGLDLVGSEFRVDSTVVRLSNINQTIDGTKTFLNPIEISSPTTSLTQAVRADRNIAVGDGLTGGGRLDDDLLIELDNTIVRTTGQQSITGTKTFLNTIIAQPDSEGTIPSIIANNLVSTIDTFALIDEDVNTINFGGGTTEINIGASTGQTNFNHNVNLASGKVFEIDDNTVLSGTSLGSVVVGSSLESVGTLTQGTWEADAIDEAYGGTGQTTYTENQILLGTSDGGLTKTTIVDGNGINTISNVNDELVIEVDDTVVQSTGNPTITGSLTVDNNTRVESLGVGVPASGVEGEIRAADQITAFFASDARLKENVTEIPNALESLDQIRGVSFDWSDEEIKRRGGEDDKFVRKHSVGVIAQEIEKIMPEAVADRPDGYKAVRYELLIPLLIQGIKDQQAQIEMLTEKVEDLCQRH